LLVTAGVVAAPDRDLVPGYVLVEDGRIAEVGQGQPRGADHRFPEGILVPGFVDLQVNGAAGADFLTCTPEQFARARTFLASTGTTSFLPTFVTAPLDAVKEAARVVMESSPDGAQPVGIHLEGPALNPARAGAHDPRWMLPPEDPRLRQLVVELGRSVRLVTLAPEQPGGVELVRWLAGQGVVASLGHTDATYAQAREAFSAGARMVTHLFNAMRGFHHREPGVVGAALEEGDWACGLVADGFHVHPAAFRLAYRLLGPERISLVTDAVSALGAPAGRYRLGSQEITAEPAGPPRLPHGTLAGSVLRMDHAVVNAVRWGVPLRDAVRMASTTPARLAGLSDRGELRPGLRADLCVLLEGQAAMTLVAGRVVWQRA
jgi:N-acetylglucosamine-6-phosphate deacetylase